MNKIRFYKKIFVKQQGYSDCGIACLRTIMCFYKGKNYSFEELRQMSGTTLRGTTLAGICEGAKKIGLTAEGFEGDIQSLKKLEQPTMLHVLVEKQRLHYVVCFGWDDRKSKFLISDPGIGVFYITENELLEIWVEKILLTFEKSSNFEYQKDTTKNKIHWINFLLKYEVNTLIISAFIGVMIAVLGLITSVFIQKLIDDLLPNGKYDKIFDTLILLVILLGLRIALSFIRGKSLADHSESFNNKLISFFYEKLLKMPLSFFEHRKTGEIIARINDVKKVQAGITQLMGTYTIDIIITIVSLCYLFFLSSSITFLIMGVLSLYFVISYFNYKSFIEYSIKVMQSYAISESQFLSSIQGIKDILSHLKQKLFIDKGITAFEQYQKQVYSLKFFQLKIKVLMDILGLSILIAVISYGVIEVKQEYISVGEFMAILSISLQINPSIARLSMINIVITTPKVAFDRIYELIETPKEAKKPRKDFIGSISKIRLENLGFAFPGNQKVFSEINLTCNSGTITVIMGKSGIGKTTILNILQKFITPTIGTVIVNENEKLDNLNTKDWMSQIGVMNQDILLFNGTILENIALDFDLSSSEKTSIIEFCQRNDFYQFFMGLPMNYLTVVEENGSNLSGGQKQIVSLARTLYKKPKLILLDEPTSSLDYESEQFVIQLLKKYKSNSITIIVTHNKELLEIADKVLDMNQLLYTK